MTICDAAGHSQQVIMTALGGCLTHHIAYTLCVNDDWSFDAAVTQHHPSYSALTRHMLLLSLSTASCNVGKCDSTATSTAQQRASLQNLLVHNLLSPSDVFA